MKRNKWQGLTCMILASLMIGTTFASSTRNAVPKPVETPKATEAPKPETSKPTETPKPAVKPTETTKPTEAPKPEITKPTEAPKPETTKPTEAPKPAAPSTTEKPKCPAPKPAAPSTTEKPKCPVPKPAAPSTTEKPKCPAPKPAAPDAAEKPAKKPFTLDHFKMIVSTLKQLGMEDHEIAASIKDGKKLEEILKAEKISTRKFKKCILKQYCKVIDEGVKQGQITKEQGKQLKAAIKQTVQNWLPKK